MAAAQGKVIITCAVTGSIHTPSMSPHLPITPDEIAEAAIGAAEAGAAIVHLHARNPKDGSPTQDPNLFRQFAGQIKAASDVVINFTTGGAPTMSIEERLRRQEFHPRGGKLQRKWQPIHAAADLSDRGGVLIGKGKGGLGRLSPLDKQPYGLVLDQFEHWFPPAWVGDSHGRDGILPFPA